MDRQTLANRAFMKSVFATLPPGTSDQSRGEPQPPLQVPHDPDAKTIALPRPGPDVVRQGDVYACMQRRRSHRAWHGESLSLSELSFLLWATQGVDQVLEEDYATLRPVPSAGARHPFETHLAVLDVDGLELGVYRYLALSHELLFRFNPDDLGPEAARATFGQRFVGTAPAVFFWTCIPYRGEWRYTIAAHKTMLLDAGHVCQSLYLACEAIGAGTCAIAAYDQEAVDELLRLDGEDEFVVYLAPVGHPASG